MQTTKHVTEKNKIRAYLESYTAVIQTVTFSEIRDFIEANVSSTLLSASKYLLSCLTMIILE